MARTIWTIGHSNHPLERFLGLLEGVSIRALADVRRFPGSRRHPHFNADALAQSLAERGIAYHHIPAMGGRRSARLEGSPNTGWRVQAFNAFADHMTTREFLDALASLENTAAELPTAIMCSEAMPWQCHRRLIADALSVRGWSVLDIMAAGKTTPHKPTEFLRVDGTQLTYPAEPLFAPDPNSEQLGE